MIRRWLLALLLAPVVLAGCGEQAATPETSEPDPAPAAPLTADPVLPAELPPAQTPAPAAFPLPAADAALSPLESSEQSAEPAAESEPSAIPVLPEPAELPPAETSGLPRLALIIDDVGHSYASGQRIIALPAPVALAILPQTPFARRLANEAVAAGQLVMLHQPMENGAGLPIGPGGLYRHTPAEDFVATVQANLDALPGVSGVNNHMGSQLTADRVAMERLMGVLQPRGLFYIDSRTTAETQAAFAAAAAGVPHASRQVFLDHVRDAGAIADAFARALDVAREEGQAIMIGHPHRVTLDFLAQALPELAAREGVALVPVTELLSD